MYDFSILKMKTIICTECKEQIKKRKELAIAGKLLQPYHNQCLEKPKSNLGKLHKFTGRYPLCIRFWFLLIVGNAFLGGILSRTPESFFVLLFFLILFNIVFVGARIGIYYIYEQHLR
ncbi:hypothetical protein SAMN02745220_01649 [Desulfopila aestuarii DSM 18488]|uniref:Uncharacterized protein n=1 Tax=Desulfopila aestuarii DSM 18488 TaxID=1121416 RepID=A0A1M7Y3N5_9BACT|nr:hypothetical protein SAMN02745220_01649 [Desulfopila aestuarii DSM 18488]